MPATRSVAGGYKLKHFIAVLFLLGLMVGLAACRGFFGQAPIALLVVTLPADTQQVPVTVTFDISGSNDPDGTIVNYEVDYGDGSAKNSGTTIPTSSFTHPYAVGGIYTVILTVTDNDGRTGMDSATVVVGQEMVFFASKRNGTYGIYRTMADGSGEAVIYDSTAYDELFPDLVRGTRDKIAYAAEEGTRWDIHTMTVTGVHISQLTTQTSSNEIQPSWSYNGGKIAYASNASDTQTPSASTWEVWTMNADGTSQTALITQTPSWAPAYSPVNNDLVFVSAKKADGTTAADGGSAILKRTAAGTLSTLQDSAGADGDVSPPVPGGLGTPLDLPNGISKPAWKPDGTKIAFSRERTVGGPIDIYVMDADGSNAESLENYVDGLGFLNTGITTDDDEFCPYWLEDGSGLAFVKEVSATYHIYKVSFSTGAVTQLTSTGNNVTPTERKVGPPLAGPHKEV